MTADDLKALNDPHSRALARMLSPHSAREGGEGPPTSHLGGGFAPDMGAALSTLVGGGTLAQAAVAQASSRLKQASGTASSTTASTALDLVAVRPPGDATAGGTPRPSRRKSSGGKKRKKSKKHSHKGGASSPPRAPSPPSNALEVMHSLG